MTDKELLALLDETQRLYERATQGRWSLGGTYWPPQTVTLNSESYIADCGRDQNSSHNAHWIAAIHGTWPQLSQELRRRIFDYDKRTD